MVVRIEYARIVFFHSPAPADYILFGDICNKFTLNIMIMFASARKARYTERFIMGQNHSVGFNLPKLRSVEYRKVIKQFFCNSKLTAANWNMNAVIQWCIVCHPLKRGLLEQQAKKAHFLHIVQSMTVAHSLQLTVKYSLSILFMDYTYTMLYFVIGKQDYRYKTYMESLYLHHSIFTYWTLKLKLFAIVCNN